MAVVICAYNSGTALQRAVQAALAQHPAQLVVIDNASGDGSLAFLTPLMAADKGRVMLAKMGQNVGFAAGCNEGTRRTRAPYVLFLNDDAILRPGYLQVLCDALERRPDAASAIGKVVYFAYGQQRIDSAGIELVRYALRPQDRGQDELDAGQYDRAEDIFAPTGAAAMYRRTALDAVGGFDAALFAYYEDVDLAWRLGRKGWRHLYVPQAVVAHRRRGPGNKPCALQAQAWCNRYRVWWRNETAVNFARYGGVAMAWESARLLRLWRRSPKLARAVLRRAASLPFVP